MAKHGRYRRRIGQIYRKLKVVWSVDQHLKLTDTDISDI